jgi:predicted negative regulator of RcsB-dependent stress response
MSYKKSRKELLGAEDTLGGSAVASVSWALDHRHLVGITIAVVALLSLCTALWSHGRDEDRAEANRLFRVAMEYYDARVGAATEDAKEARLYATEAEKWKAALPAFEAAMAAGGDVGHLATLYVADVRIHLDNKEGAIAALEGLIKALDPKDSLRFLAVERLAQLKAEKGDVDGANAAYGELDGGLRDGDHTAELRRMVGYRRARLLADAGRADEARTVLKTLGDVSEESSVSGLLAGLRQQLGDVAAAAVAPTPVETKP